jgi:protease I
MPDLKGKKVVMIIASRDFRDEEFKDPYDYLKACGAEVTVASSKLDEATGMLGMKVKPGVLIGDVKVDGYDAVIFVGGSGASEYFNNATAHALAQAAVEKKKLLAAICVAPSTLANAGVLKGRKATCWDSERANLKAKGADVQKGDVVRDGSLVTGSGPRAAREFARTVAGALAGK